MNFLRRGGNSNTCSPGEKRAPSPAWSPLPPKKNFTKELIDDGENLYPNCDGTVWLRSCEKEIIEPITGKVTGKIPEWLKGSLIRNGPGSLKAGNEYFQHLFDSSALLHRFGIENGMVTYQCRFLQSETYKKNWKANRIIVTEFATNSVPDPCHTIFQRVASKFNPKSNESDNAMISVYPFGDELYAFAETTVIHKVNQTTLETEGKVDIGDNVMIVNHTSHPHVMKDGSVYNLGLSFKRLKPHYSIVKFPHKLNSEPSENMFKKAFIQTSIPARWPLSPSYMHTFGITENYFIIVEQPFSVSLPTVIKNKITNTPLIGSLRWFQEEKTQINVISRKSGHLISTYLAAAFFYLHIINQYEEDDCVILDICCYKDPAMLECMYVDAIKNMQKNPDYARMFRGRPLRFVLPLKVDTNAPYDCKQNLIKMPNTKAKAFHLSKNKIFVQPEVLCNLGCETPRIYYEQYLGVKYQYFYAISSDVDAENPGTLIKVDTVNKTRLTWCENNCYPSEPIFVASPNGQTEDDGVVLASMVWGKEDTNQVGLIVLDAKTFTEIARAEFKTPGPVPKCLHGWFLNSSNNL